MATKSKNTKKKISSAPEFYPDARYVSDSAFEYNKQKKEKPKGNLFGGMVSWVCRIFFIYAFVCGVLALIAMTVDPGFSATVEEFFSIIFDNVKASHEMEMRINTGVAVLLIMFILMFWFRKGRKRFEKGLADIQSNIWIEFKVIAIVILLYVSFITYNMFIFNFFAVFLLYLLFLDIGHNGNIFKRNIVSSVLHAVNTSDLPSAYAKRAKRRFVSMILVIVGVIILSIILFAILVEIWNNLNVSDGIIVTFMVSVILFALAGIIGAIMWYSLAQKKDLEDLSELTNQIEEMYEGNLAAVNTIPPNSNFYDCAMQLNMIRTGIEKAVEEGIKADRTKVELITNVSHDIKTPLTSIISYVELLKKEEDLPPHVIDYVNTISAKAERLRSIVQDVFEVSKAATGNINLSMEDLDIGKLLQQTIAEMDETMAKSELQWRIDIPDVPFIVYADGQKLYRVFQNLIRNCAQYSLEGSRAYITIRESSGIAEVTIRNIARNELDPDAAENLTERFIRGDQTRTTEGSGLGLSIAKSFTEAIGGIFTVKTDGDIFIVTVGIPLVGGNLSGAPIPSPIIGSEVNTPSTITMEIPINASPSGDSTSIHSTTLNRVSVPVNTDNVNESDKTSTISNFQQSAQAFAEKIPDKINLVIENISGAIGSLDDKDVRTDNKGNSQTENNDDENQK